jgi:hypothetical protein
MHRYAYADNFKGFQDSLLSLTSVNFFVGDNSSGKTSFLTLVHILNRPSLWMSVPTSLESDDVHLGNYSDLISRNAQDKSHFSVGALVGQDTKHFTAYLITFASKQGMPAVSRYSLARDGKQVHVKFGVKLMHTSPSSTALLDLSYPSVRALFGEWALEHATPTSSYRTASAMVAGIPPALGLLNQLLLEEPLSPAGPRRLQFGVPAVFDDVVLLAPIRARPKTTYDEYSLSFSKEGTHTPYVCAGVWARQRLV